MYKELTFNMLYFLFIYRIREVESMINMSILVEILFWIGIILALIGGLMIVVSFHVFKRKVMKTPIYKEVEAESKKGIPWGYILLVSGIIIFFISYYLSIR